MTPYGLRVLNGEEASFRSLFSRAKKYFATLTDVLDEGKARGCMELMDKHLRPHLSVEQRRIPPESITGMTENYTEFLNKTMHIKTAFFRRRTARSYEAAQRVGLLRMMRSESFRRFAEVISGYKLDSDLNLQVSCYEPGDYVGPHNDHHPEFELIRDGFIDFHVMFTNDAVAHHYLVYAEKDHFSKIIDINVQGGVSVYRLPFWHYTTPLAAKPGREHEARRWLLLGSYTILGSNNGHTAGKTEEGKG